LYMKYLKTREEFYRYQKDLEAGRVGHFDDMLDHFVKIHNGGNKEEALFGPFRFWPNAFFLAPVGGGESYTLSEAAVWGTLLCYLRSTEVRVKQVCVFVRKCPEYLMPESFNLLPPAVEAAEDAGKDLTGKTPPKPKFGIEAPFYPDPEDPEDPNLGPNFNPNFNPNLVDLTDDSHVYQRIVYPNEGHGGSNDPILPDFIGGHYDSPEWVLRMMLWGQKKCSSALHPEDLRGLTQRWGVHLRPSYDPHVFDKIFLRLGNLPIQQLYAASYARFTEDSPFRALLASLPRERLVAAHLGLPIYFVIVLDAANLDKIHTRTKHNFEDLIPLSLLLGAHIR
jgi:hypothetical protein